MGYRDEQERMGAAAAAKDFVLFLSEKKFANATRFSVTEATGSRCGALRLYDDGAEKYVNRPIFNFVTGRRNIRNDEYLFAIRSIFYSYFSAEKTGKSACEIIREIARDLERQKKVIIAEKLEEAANGLSAETAEQIYCYRE